jgi:hypothetical protein
MAAGAAVGILGAANPVGLIGAGVGALAGIARGLIGGRKRRREERAAQAEFSAMKSRYQALDTSNPYKNITNTFEDLTINTQAAEFAQQQAEQSRADILSNLAASAGGGGIAALAQSLANQQTQAAQAAAASIGQQEQRNQMLAAQGEARMQQMRASGEAMSQRLEMQKTANLLQMSAGRLQQARQARQQATQSLVGGIAGAAGMVGGAALAGGGNIGQGFKSMMGMQSSLPSPTPSLDARVMQSMPSPTDVLMENINFALPPAGAYTPLTLNR